MRCNKCGHENEENVRFCIYCGNKFEKEKKSLLERAKNKDQYALAEIYSQSCSAVYRVIRVLVKDEDTVNDLVQDTYVKAFTRLEQLQDEEKLLPWLKMIATNTAKDWLKKCKPVYFNELSDQSEDTEDISFEESIEDESIDLNPEMAMDKQEVSRLVMEILDQLPEDQRMVIGMFYYEEMSVKDIAEVLEVSDNTVKSRLNYGRKKIKELVLDLEKKGTRLYNVAPCAFFIYLLRCMEKSPAEAPNMGMLTKILENGNMRVGEPVEPKTEAKEPISTKKNAGSNVLETEKAVENTASKAGNTVGKAASTVGKTAGKAAGGAAKRAGMKVAAWALAGTIAVGGVTYGIVKNADKIPFLQKQEENSNINPEETADIQEEESVEEPEVTEEPEATETPETTEEPEITEAPEPTETPEVTEPVQEEQPKNAIVPIAQGTYGDNIQWYLDLENTLVVVGSGAIADVDIMGANVERPTWEAYQDQICKIVIGEGITYIGNYTFSISGTHLTEISMADTVTEIGEGAFGSVPIQSREVQDGITVTLSQSLEKIGDYAFAFTDITSIILPDSVKEIGNGAFRRCYQLSSLTVGENSQLETIGSEAFAECPLDLSEIQLPKGLQRIKSEAFWYGSFQEEVTFSDQLQELGLRAFGRTCTGLNTVYFTGDAPTITDERIANPENDTVFPDETTLIYYPQGNSTWDNFNFSQLAENAEFISYAPTENQESNNTPVYYSTQLHEPFEGSDLPGTISVEVDGDYITFYASFRKSAVMPFDYQDAEFVPYGEMTFEIAEDMKCGYVDMYGTEWVTKEKGIRNCERMNGLVCTLKVVNGKIEEMLFNS